jgi:hypothetical protein
MLTSDTEAIAAQIEHFLLDAGGWVSTAEIRARFAVPERLLRQDGDRPALLDGFAVSSTRSGASGYIHHRHLPTSEWLPIKHRLLRHALGELRRVRAWSRARCRLCAGLPGRLVEAHTGQLLLPIVRAG